MSDRPQLIEKLDELGFLNGKPVYKWYLPLLNLYFPDEGEVAFIDQLKKIAIAVKDDDKFISELICDFNWRPTLIGNAIAILLRKKQLQANMIWRIENWNWVAPQLAVGIAILDDGKGEKIMSECLSKASVDSNPKSILSIYASLQFLGSPAAAAFRQTPLFIELSKKDEWDRSVHIAETQWDFWRNIDPIKN